MEHDLSLQNLTTCWLLRVASYNFFSRHSCKCVLDITARHLSFVIRIFIIIIIIALIVVIAISSWFMLLRRKVCMMIHIHHGTPCAGQAHARIIHGFTRTLCIVITGSACCSLMEKEQCCSVWRGTDHARLAIMAIALILRQSHRSLHPPVFLLSRSSPCVRGGLPYVPLSMYSLSPWTRKRYGVPKEYGMLVVTHSLPLPAARQCSYV